MVAVTISSLPRDLILVMGDNQCAEFGNLYSLLINCQMSARVLRVLVFKSLCTFNYIFFKYRIKLLLLERIKNEHESSTYRFLDLLFLSQELI